MGDVLQTGEMISSNEMLTTIHWRKRTIGRSRASENCFATGIPAFSRLRTGTSGGLL